MKQGFYLSKRITSPNTAVSIRPRKDNPERKQTPSLGIT